MVHELLQLLPPQAGTVIMGVAIAGVTAGLGLWLVGSRVSRGLITLALVAAGGWAGMRLPGWMGWEIDPMGPAVVLALLLGLSGFVLHRVWIGIGLGVVLATWAAAVCWLIWQDGSEVPWPALDQPINVREWAQAVWSAQPTTLQRVLPVAAIVSFLAGGALALLWPRMASAVMYSLVGVSLITGWGLLLLHTRQPQWIEQLPTQPWIQAVTVAVMVLIGIAAQWALGPRSQPAKQAPAAEPEN